MPARALVRSPWRPHGCDPAVRPSRSTRRRVGRVCESHQSRTTGRKSHRKMVGLADSAHPTFFPPATGGRTPRPARAPVRSPWRPLECDPSVRPSRSAAWSRTGPGSTLPAPPAVPASMAERPTPSATLSVADARSQTGAWHGELHVTEPPRNVSSVPSKPRPVRVPGGAPGR